MEYTVVRMRAPSLVEPPIDPGTIRLLYVDEHIVVANKPSGLLVHRGWGDDHDVALFRVRDTIGERVNAVHRLDRGTSGAVLFARTSEATAVLCRDFETARIEKRYLALVRGTPPDQGVIDHPVPKKESGARVPAITRYRRIMRSTVDRCSLVEAMPETGRLHQIRRHLKHLNHPVIGDVNYGSGEINRHYRAQYNLHRLALHAYFLAFEHPLTNTRIVITAPMPDDLRSVLSALGLPHSAEAAASGGAAP
jgi:tRNA pseudouridine65 synthase